MRNERGSTLVLVLLVSAVLLTVSLTIFSLTVGGTKRTEIRRQDVTKTQNSIEIMNRAIADFKQAVQELPNTAQLDDSLESGLYEAKLGSIRSQLQEDYTSTDGAVLTIMDTTQERLGLSVDYTRKYFTRAYEFTVQYINKENNSNPEFTKVTTRNVYISPTPSFLQYAVGSESTLHLNGASDITGSVYADTMYTGNVAKYVNELTADTNTYTYRKAKTLYPAIQGNVVINKELNVLDNETEEKTSPTETFSKHTLSLQKRQSFLPYFYTKDEKREQLPFIRKSYDSFVSVDFAKTFVDKLNSLNLDGEHLTLKKEDIQASGFGNTITAQMLTLTGGPSLEAGVPVFNSSTHSIHIIEKHVNPVDLSTDFTLGSYASKKVLLATDLPGTASSATSDAFIINSNLKMNPDQWLVVNGNLEIYSNGNPVSVQGNILVMGDIIIHGNALNFGHEQDSISFYSSIYTTGKATIYSTNITGIDGKQLVLLSQGDLLITRINEFERVDSSIRPMDAFFYTDQNAELYGVGSLFKIHGGIFAKEMLTINAIRQTEVPAPGVNVTSNQTVSPIQLSIASREMQKTQPSRFVVEYDKSVILDQLAALPQVNTLQVLIDDYTVDTKKN